MPTLHFAIRIDRSPEVVWATMLEHPTYEDWTSAFSAGSTFEGSWETGARMLFLAPDAAGTMSGMLSEIAESRPHEFVSIRHVGMVHAGVEDLDSDAVRAWVPAYENYTFGADGDATELSVTLDTPESHVEMMNGAWARGLERLKAICEARV